MDKILEIENIKKIYHMGEITVEALAGVSFYINKGEFIVILGQSGSGKSTMLNIIGGIDKPTSGTIKYNNKDISNFNEKNRTLYRRNNIGFIFQFYNLIPNLTVRENVLLASELSQKPLSINETLDAVGLLERMTHFPSQLSGGQQQRVAIARAIVKNPEILLCDEPTGALDFSTGEQVLELLKTFNKKYNKTVIVITHNESIAEMADRVFYIKDGLIEKITEKS